MKYEMKTFYGNLDTSSEFNDWIKAQKVAVRILFVNADNGFLHIIYVRADRRLTVGSPPDIE